MTKNRAFIPWVIGLLLIMTSSGAWAGYEDYLPTNKELPLGYKLVETTRIRHPWFSEPVTMGEWQLGKKEGADSRIIIYIGSRQGEFDRRIEELAQRAGEIKPGPIELGAGEDRVFSHYLRGDYNIYFTKGSFGVLVEAVGTDDLPLKKITSEQGVDIILRELAQRIAKNLPGEAQKDLDESVKDAYPVLWVVLSLLLPFILIMQIRRNYKR